jgi:hypothetical protein
MTTTRILLGLSFGLCLAAPVCAQTIVPNAAGGYTVIPAPAPVTMPPPGAPYQPPSFEPPTYIKPVPRGYEVIPPYQPPSWEPPQSNDDNDDGNN